MKRIYVGQVLKGKDGGSDYIKIDNDVSLKKGQTLQLESKTALLERLESANNAGKISEDYYQKQKERVEKTPDFVRFSIVLVDKNA